MSRSHIKILTSPTNAMQSFPYGKRGKKYILHNSEVIKELSFSSLEAAEKYLQEQGLEYSIVPENKNKIIQKQQNYLEQLKNTYII